MKPMKKFLKSMEMTVLTGTFLLAAVTSLAGCSKKAKSNAPSLRLANDITSNYTPIINTAVLEGLAEKNGVCPIIDYNDGIEPLITGKIDGRLTDLVASLITGGNGEDLAIFAGTMGGGHIVYANKNVAGQVRDLKNWKGRTIGARVKITPQLVLAHALKEKYGYSDEDVTFKFFDNDQAIMAACAKGEIDIGTTYYAYKDTAEAQGLVIIAELVDLAPDYACCRQTANGKKVKSDRNLFVAWTKGLIEAWKVYNTDEKTAIKAVKKITKQDDTWVRQNIYDPERTAHITFNPDPFYNGCLAQYQICVDKGYINKENPRPLPEYFDISIYADALKEVIAENADDKFYKDMWTYFVSHNNEYPDFEKKYPATL